MTAALLGISSNVKLTIGLLLRSRNGAVPRCLASRLLIRAFNADHFECMNKLLSQCQTSVATQEIRLSRGPDHSKEESSRDRGSCVASAPAHACRQAGEWPRRGQ